MPRKKSITINDVAKEVGLSKSAVSAALSGNVSTISLPEQTRKRILSAARKLNYKPNILARSMIEQRSFLIGVLLRDVNTSLYTELIRGIQDQLVGRSYAPIIFTHCTPEEETTNLHTCVDRKVDGLIVNCSLGNALDSKQGAFIKSVYAETPMVELFGRESNHCVVLDYEASGKMATKHLLDLGHRKIALLTHERFNAAKSAKGEHWNAWEHYQGYEDQMRLAGLTPRVFTHELTTAQRPELGWADAVEAIAPSLLGGSDRPTAIICYDDRQAYGLIRACRAMGIALPDELSIVGHLDLEASSYMEPALTSLAVPTYRVGAKAAQMLFDLMQGQPVTNMSFAPQFIGRKSCATLDARSTTGNE